MPDTDTDRNIQREDKIDERANERFANHPNPQSRGNSSDLANNESGTGSAYANDPKNRGKSLQDQEENNFFNPSPNSVEGKSFMDKVRGLPAKWRGLSTKKKLSIGGVTGTVGVLGLLGSMLSTSLLPLNVMQNLTQTNDTTSPSMERRFLKVFGNAVGPQDPICAKSTKKMKCKMGRISNSALYKLEKKGVKAYGPERTKRTGYPAKNPRGYAIDIGDGKIKNVKAEDMLGFLRQAENRKIAAKILGTGGVFNPSRIAWSGKYIASKLYNKFNLRRDGGVADGSKSSSSIKERYAETLEKLRSRIPGAQAVTNATEPIKEKVTTRLEKSKKGGPIYLSAVAGCIAPKIPRYIAAGVAGVQLAQVMSAAMDVGLSPGSKLKANAVEGTYTADDANRVGTLLTEKTPRASDGKLTSAMDSQYLLSAMGVNQGKPAVSKDFSPGYAVLSSAVVAKAVATDKKAAPACDKILSPEAMWTAAATDAAVTVVASATIVGGIIKVAASWTISTIVVKMVSKAVTSGPVKKLLVNIAKSDKIPKASGEALGDVVGIGAAGFFSAGGMARHLPTLTKSQLVSYDNLYRENEKFNREMDIASLSPFDTSSRYTFLGSIVHSPKLATLLTAKPSSMLGNLISLPALALSTNAGAASIQSQTYCDYAEEYGYDTTGDAPAINMAGLPCVGLTSEQDSIGTARAINLMTNEKFFDESVATSDDDTLENLLESGYIKEDTPLADYMSECSNAESGNYLFNADSCTLDYPGGSKSSKNIDLCFNDTDADGNSYKNCADSTSDFGGSATAKQVDDPESIPAIASWLLDYQILQAMNGEDAEPVASSNASGGEFNIASYNILRVTDKKHTAAVCRALGLPNNQTCTERRIKNQADIINGTTELNNKPFDLVMTQEMTPTNYREMKKVLPQFDSYVNEEFGIFWRKSTFPEKFEEGTVASNSGSGRTLQAPWVGLRSVTGQTVYALSFHYSSFAQFNGSPAETTKGAKRTLAWVKSKNSDDAIVVLGGDAGYFSKYSARVFNSSGILKNVGLMAAGKPSKGDNKAVGADQLYITPKLNLSIKDYERPPETPGSIVVKASDHAPVYGTVVIPGATSVANSTGNISWPVDKKWWTKNKTDFIDAHGLGSGSWTNGVNGLAVDIGSPPDGSPVYSMFDGTVSRGTLGGHGLIISSKVQDGTLDIAYAHGPRTNKDTSYSSGDKIMTIGCLGNCTGGHLHMDMSFNGKGVCPQDVFIAMAAGQTPNFSELTKKAKAPCGRVQYAYSPL